jgi:predicted DCC family thiol-disulfide oxidoreductase YuxK
MSTLTADSPALHPESEHPILFFDGVCNLCNSTIDFLIRRDQRRKLRYAPLQGETAVRLLGIKEAGQGDPDSIVLLRKGRLSRRSGAVLRVLADLGGIWRLALLCLLVPWPLRDRGYKFIATHRYQWFGRRDTCRIPTLEERRLFLP